MMNTKLLIFLFALLALAACQTSTTSTNGNSVDSTTKVADAINAPLLADSMPPPATSTPTIPVNCGKSSITTFGGINVWKLDSSKTICFKAGMAIDADGSPNAYCPDNKGLDYTANAGHPAANGEPADWFGVVVDAQKNPVVQKAGDPIAVRLSIMFNRLKGCDIAFFLVFDAGFDEG